MPRKITTDEGRAALAAVRAAEAASEKPPRTDLATAVRYLLQLLVEKAPGGSGRGARAAVRRSAGDRGPAAHAGHAAERRRDRRRDVDRARDR